MKSFEFERWDEGRLTVNRDFADLLRSNGFDTFDAWMNHTGGDVAKNLLRERVTTRIELRVHEHHNVGRASSPSYGGARAVYIKRHTPPPWKEYVKPYLRFTRPILGARNEWQALLRFHAEGISTMVPVAMGECGRRSFLVTDAIEGCVKLSDWMEQHLTKGDSGASAASVRIAERLGTVARRMHGAGLHHQDFYLTHLLVPEDDVDAEVRVIDLGRVRKRRRLGTRWIVKDLAQLNYSARHFTEAARERFLETYLGRAVAPADARLLQRIRRKTHAIARHSKRNAL